MDKRAFVLLLSFSTIALAAPNLHEPARKLAPLISSELDSSDVQFLATAAESESTEIKLGELAATRAVTAEVKSFGESIARDHNEANAELQKLAEKKGVPILKTATAAQKSAANKLSKFTGPKFDKAYMDEVIQSHQKQIGEFERAAHSSDPDIKSFAEKVLPALNEHLLLAKKLTGMAARPSTSPNFRANVMDRAPE